jgi:4-amino-4-deoxy-L-arabinose transferase-like glycosyltransferase
VDNARAGTMTKASYRTLTALAFAAAAALRLLLWWANPPGNSFDDQFTPILMIMKSGTIPATDACWMCYHPPVFYWTSAMVGKLVAGAGAGLPLLVKCLQFLPCLYGVLTVWLVHLILKELPLSDFSRLIAFATACFLPRHIYMSAMNSNDSLSYLLAALALFLLLAAARKGMSPLLFLAAGAAVTAAVFTKYTAMALLPAVLVFFVSRYRARRPRPTRELLLPFILTFLLPAAALGAYMARNAVREGSLLPSNIPQLDPSRTQPHDPQGMSFLSFKPWETVTAPIIAPGRMHSAWTLMYTGMWFDNEPKFLYFVDKNRPWWAAYFGWLRGERSFPGDNTSLPMPARAAAAVLIALGLVPLSFMAAGGYACARAWRRKDEAPLMMFPALLLANAAGIAALAARLPVFSAVKASYFLVSLPAFAVLLALGLMLFEERRAMKPAVSAVFSCLFAFSAFQILLIVRALKPG